MRSRPEARGAPCRKYVALSGGRGLLAGTIDGAPDQTGTPGPTKVVLSRVLHLTEDSRLQLGVSLFGHETLIHLPLPWPRHSCATGSAAD
jgi:hypothetical protein